MSIMSKFQNYIHFFVPKLFLNLFSSFKMNKKGNMAIKFQDNMILQTRKYLKRKIMCPETKCRHHEKERQYVLDLVKRTVETGESNSALLIGPEDTGKTTVSFFSLQQNIIKL